MVAANALATYAGRLEDALDRLGDVALDLASIDHGLGPHPEIIRRAAVEATAALDATVTLLKRSVTAQQVWMKVSHDRG